jgi:hypothetical protein
LTNQERRTRTPRSGTAKRTRSREKIWGKQKPATSTTIEETPNGNPKPRKVERRERQWPEKRGVAGIKTFVNPLAPLSSAPTGFLNAAYGNGKYEGESGNNGIDLMCR